MKKLLLTSTGLGNNNIAQEFLRLLGKPPSLAKIIFIPTASRSPEELVYVEASRQELLEIGFLPQNIITLDLNQSFSEKEIENSDAIYVCGGNTFYLLHKVRETGFDEFIKKFTNQGKLYFGVSAGSLLAGPDIDIASPFDENDIGLHNFVGLKLTDVIVSPHYVGAERSIVDDYQKKTSFKIIPLTDDEALLIEGDKQKIIS